MQSKKIKQKTIKQIKTRALTQNTQDNTDIKVCHIFQKCQDVKQKCPLTRSGGFFCRILVLIILQADSTCGNLHNYRQNHVLSDLFSLVIMVLYQSEPSVYAVIWKIYNCYLPSLSSPQTNSIVGSHTGPHTHVSRQNGHNRRTCMLAHTHKMEHQSKERRICLIHTIHICVFTRCDYCPLLPLLKVRTVGIRRL